MCTKLFLPNDVDIWKHHNKHTHSPIGPRSYFDISASDVRTQPWNNNDRSNKRRWLPSSAGRYTGSYRIPVFIFLMIWIFKIPQYRCHLNNVWNATLLERGLFSLLHFGENTAVCVTKRESSETEALVECDEREEVMHNIHIDRYKYPPSAASAPTSLTN